MSHCPSVLIISFNRADLTQRVLKAVEKAMPKELFLAIDGPRNEKDAVLCEGVKKVLENIPWDCKVHRLYHTKNHGCKKGVVSAITWFFEHVEEGIILEDDCIPTPDFFEYCGKMLDIYKNDSTVGHISGYNAVEIPNVPEYNHVLIKYAHIWGWATWRRVWKDYNIDPLKTKTFQWNVIPGGFLNKLYFYRNLIQIHIGKLDTWDFQYQYLLWQKGCKCALPVNNMVFNDGFDERATHTKEKGFKGSEQQAGTMNNRSFKVCLNEEISQSAEIQMHQTFFKRNTINELKRFLISYLSFRFK